MPLTRHSKKKEINKVENRGEFELYTTSEVKKMLQVSQRTLYRYMKSGKLEGIKIGNKWRVSKASLQQFIDGGKSNTPAAQ
jgi:excisionase family DNA binding protein